MARCYLTGIEISLDDAFVLDLTVAHRLLRELRERVATLERLVAQLGEADRVQVRNRDGSGTVMRKDRRVVSHSMAQALSALASDRELFVRWTDWRARGRFLPLAALREHPDYGARLRSLSVAELESVAELGRQVLGRLARGQHLSYEIRIAVMAGVCVSLRDRSAEEVVTILNERIGSEPSLGDLDVPVRIERALRDTLGRRPANDWGITGGELAGEAFVAEPGPDAL